MSGIPGLIVLLSQNGCWFGGQPGTIRFVWSTLGPPTAVVVSWELGLGELKVASNSVRLDKPELSLTLPEVRVPTDFEFVYRLHDAATGKGLGQSRTMVHCYPTNLLSGLATLLKHRRVVVLDNRGKLASLLGRSGVDHRRIEHESDLQLARVDLLIVAPDELRDGPFSQQLLLAHVKAGMAAIIFGQDRVAELMGHTLVSVPPGRTPVWEADHPLLADLSIDRCADLLASRDTLHAIRLDDASPAACYWPEGSTDPPAQVRALLANHSLGKGSLVLCQLPINDWEHDPRIQILLRNAIRCVDAQEPALPLRPLASREAFKATSTPTTSSLSTPTGE